MENKKFTRQTMDRIIDHSDDGFMDKLMKEVDSDPNFKKYLQDMIARPPLA